MKMLVLLLVVSLQLLLRPSQWLPTPDQSNSKLDQSAAASPSRTSLIIIPTAKGSFLVRLPARHGALQVSVLDEQNHPIQPPQLVAAATTSLTLDASQWPAGHYQLQIRSASGLISTSLHVH